jgi:hypothetical protein
MKQHGKKLIISGIFLTIAILLLVGASVAWFTISTKPEVGGMQVKLYTDRALLVSDSENGSYGQLLNLGDALNKYVPLRPVSTVDGVNWFLPTYMAAGPLKDPSEFILDNSLSHANIKKYTSDGTELTGAALKAAQEQGYYVCAEFWLKTQEESCKVRLSVPSDASSLDDWEKEQGTYGTYALADYELKDNNLSVLDTRAQTALRVGFLIGKGTSTQRFVIYEPNADERSSLDKPSSSTSSTGDRYVVGYDNSATDYLDGYYIPTYPIAKNASGVGAISGIDSGNLIIQRKSAWNTAALQTTLQNGKIPGSNQVATMGSFIGNSVALINSVDKNTGMASMTGNTAIAGGTTIITLTKNTPQKVQMFVWIEGQDVDCWNDIAAGSFIINLELAGETD